jgi:capsular polysaccharide transport system ATP-binding protein
MIQLVNVSKTYQTRSGKVQVLNNINFSLGRGEHVGILGRNGAGKSTLIRLISGAERPSQGNITRSMSVSWPLAFGGAFQTALTGLDNLRFICRVYNVDPTSRIEQVERFSELGVYFREPVRTYSAGMRARLAFAISMAVEFDCFLVDEVIAVGDDRFQKRCHHELFEKRADRARIIVSHDPNIIRQSCTRASVLERGKLSHFDDVDSAYEFYAERMA